MSRGIDTPIKRFPRAFSGTVVSAVILLSALCMLLLNGCGKSKPRKPNLLLVSVDTLRADRLHCYGNPASLSPTVDALASQGLRFETCFAHASLTVPSVASLLTGLYPSQAGAKNNRTPLSKSAESLASAMKRKGYRTAAFVSNFTLRPRMRFNQGFDHYDAEFTTPELNRPEILTRNADTTVDAVLTWLDEATGNADSPFFLWIHLQDPHGPYTPPEDFIPEIASYPSQRLDVLEDDITPHGIPSYQLLGEENESAVYRARYDGEILFFDHHLSRLIDTLDRLDLKDDTAVIFTADHGEAMGEHGFWFSHGQDLFNELIHVPLIIAAPWIEADQPKETAALMDIFPTLMALAGAGSDELAGYRGINLLDPGARRKVRPIYSEVKSDALKTRLRSLVMGRWKLIASRNKKDAPQLFDLEKDPVERQNVYASEPEVAEKMEMILNAEQQRAESGEKAEELPLTPEELKVLEALGYTGK
ncbi:MAG: sulfatase [Planctomycetota bacterium]|jgi:arylsulfatase A-like enzyme